MTHELYSLFLTKRVVAIDSSYYFRNDQIYVNRENVVIVSPEVMNKYTIWLLNNPLLAALL